MCIRDRSNLLRRIAARIHVLCYRSLRYRLQFLVYHGHSHLKGFIRIVNLYFLSIQKNLALVHVINTEKAFHQGRLAGSVLSHESMNRTLSLIHI